MEQVGMIGIDLAKGSFQFHGAGPDGSVVFRKRLSRGKVLGFLASQPRCVVAMEACASAHHWGRETERLGHEVKLIPPIHVRPFVKRRENDTADGGATCEAAQCPTMRPTMSFVAVKTEGRQASRSRGMLSCTRDLLVRQRTRTINALRGHLAGFGVVAAQGAAHVGKLAPALEDPGPGLPAPVRSLGGVLLEQVAGLDGQNGALDTLDTLDTLDKELHELHAGARRDGQAARLMRYRGSGRSPQWRFRPSRRRWRASGGGAASPPGSASCRDSMRPAASRDRAGYRGWASATSGGS